MTDHNTWTAETFLYDKFLTLQTQTSGHKGSSPIDVYNSYLLRDVEKRGVEKGGVDIDTLCNLGADIMNIIEASGLEGIEPEFHKRCIWWRFRNQKLFGINLVTTKPRLMFEPFWWEYLQEVYPEYEFVAYSSNVKGLTFKRDVTVEELEGAFIDKLRDVASEQGVDLDM